MRAFDVGQINLLQEELQQIQRREALSSVEREHRDQLDTRGVQTPAEVAEPLTEGWRAYWLGFMAGLAIAVIVPLWTGLREQKVALERFEDTSRGKRTPAQILQKAETLRAPGLGRKGNGLR